MSAKLAHLGMIQGIITRMAGFSANAKNFCITIIAALVGISFQQRLPELLPAALVVVAVFAVLDIYYLAQERRFRRHYKAVVSRQLAEGGRLDLSPPKLTFGQYWSATRSFSTGGFYALLLIVTALILLVAYGRPEAGMERIGGSASAAEARPSAQPNGLSPDQGSHRERMAEQNRSAASVRVRELPEPEPRGSSGPQPLQRTAPVTEPANRDVRPHPENK